MQKKTLESQHYETVKFKEIDIKRYTKQDWHLGGNHLVRVYENLEIDGDLDQEFYWQSYDAILVKGDLIAHGNIVDHGIHLCVGGETRARNIVSEDGLILLNEASIEHFTIGSGNDGEIHIETLMTNTILNFGHYTAVENTEQVIQSMGTEQMVVHCEIEMYTTDLVEFLVENKYCLEYVDSSKDSYGDIVHYLEADKIIKTILAGQEGKIHTMLRHYRDNATLRDKNFDTNHLYPGHVDVEWKHGKVHTVSISETKGLNTFAAAVKKSDLTTFDTLEIGRSVLNYFDDESMSQIEISNLPAELSQLTGLKKLKIVSGDLTKVPDEIAFFSGLESLELQENEITVIPPWIDKLTNLKELDLNSNEITELPGSFSSLARLEVLDLSYNDIKGIGTAIKGLNQLRSLDLSGSGLTEVPECIQYFTSLEYLYLGDNDIQNIPEWIEELGQLKTLVMNDNKIKSIPEAITDLKKLEFLNLSANKLKTIPEYLTKLKMLNDLDLRDNKFTEAPDCIAKMTKLQELDLSNTNLYQMPKWIGELKKLQVFYFEKNKIAKLPESLAELKKLKRLYLKGNKINPIPKWLEKMKLSDLEI